MTYNVDALWKGLFIDVHKEERWHDNSKRGIQAGE